MQSRASNGNDRAGLFPLRRENNENSLREDVHNILGALPDGTAIKYHVGQFSIFWPKAYECLKTTYEERKLDNYDEQKLDNAQISHEAFLSQAISALTAQWSILRTVAFQRLPNSPYLHKLQQLDERTQELYERLLQALPIQDRPTWQRLSASYPLVYIGDTANLRLFGDAPAVISVSFGALYPDSQSRNTMPDQADDAILCDPSTLAIGHELGHLVCDRMPDLLGTLEDQITQKLHPKPKEPPSAKQAMLLRAMLPWLEEIVADLFGAALHGPDFAFSALSIGISPDGLLTRSDGKHPPSVIRPWIQLELLKFLAKQDPAYQTAHGGKIGALEEKLKQVTETFMSSRFQTGATVAVVSLGDVRKASLELVDALLHAKLGSPPSQQSMGQVFLTCAKQAPPTSPDVRQTPWGEQIRQYECADLVLEAQEKGLLGIDDILVAAAAALLLL